MSASLAVEHRLLGLDRRKIAPTLGVLAVITLWAVIVPWIGSVLSFDDELPPGTPIEIGEGVTFTPPAGWEPSILLEPNIKEVHHSGLTAEFTLGSFTGEPADLLAAVNQQKDLDSIATPSGNVTSIDGVVGVAETFHGANTHGLVAAFVSGELGLEIVIVGPEPMFTNFSDDIEAMLASVNFSGGAVES